MFDKDKVTIFTLIYCHNLHSALVKTETRHSQAFKLTSLGFFHGSVDVIKVQNVVLQKAQKPVYR